MEHLSHKEKITIMIAILSAMFFAAINMTIVGTSLPKIVSIIGGMEHYDWIFTVYMLTSTVSAMLVGKLSDIYGRKIFILIGIGVFMTGAFLSGTSESILQLILYRGFQGFGGGMIMSTAFATVGDLFSPRERGRWQGLMGGVFGLSSLFGPTLGGYIVDNFDWQWVFWVFLPLGFIAFFLILKLYPNQKEKKNETIDYLGALLLTTLIVSLLLGFSWGGNKYEWLSVQIITLFIITIISLFLLIFVEKRAKNPMLPLFLFKNNVFTISNVIGLLLGMVMFGVIMYIPLYVQGVQGESATVSGLVEMTMTVSMVMTSAIIGNLITKKGKYKVFGIIGFLIITIGLFLNTTLNINSGIERVIPQLMVIGLGLGMTMPVFQLTIQNSVEHKYLGVATSTMQVFRQVGGTLGVAIMGTIMNKLTDSKMTQLQQEDTLLSNVTIPKGFEHLQNPQILMNPEALEKTKAMLPESYIDYFDAFITILKESLNYSITHSFLFIAIMASIALFLSFFLKEIPLRSTNKPNDLVENDKENQ